MLMMKRPKNLEFEPVHPKNVLLASVVHVYTEFPVYFFGEGDLNLLIGNLVGNST
jgi:hypothetical protein